MKTKSVLLFFILMVFVVLISLSGNSFAIDGLPSILNKSPDNPVLVSASKKFHSEYVGTIGDKCPITMVLLLNGIQVYGNYKYKGKNQAIIVKGTLDEAGKLELNEFFHDERTGSFEGKVTGNSISGRWRSEDRSRTMNFVVFKTADIKPKLKKDALQDAVGTYFLHAVLGNVGANGVFEFNRKKGNWNTSYSEISGSGRGGQSNFLSKRDKSVLNSVRIIIDSTLNIHFYAGDKLLLDLPFSENGMRFDKILDKNNPLFSEWRSYSSSTVYIDDILYLAAIDKVDYSAAIDVGELIGSGALILEYIPEKEVFELTITRESSCCDSNTLTFSREGTRVTKR
jgi:hypothetical protein